MELIRQEVRVPAGEYYLGRTPCYIFGHRGLGRPHQ